MEKVTVLTDHELKEIEFINTNTNRMDLGHKLKAIIEQGNEMVDEIEGLTTAIGEINEDIATLTEQQILNAITEGTAVNAANSVSDLTIVTQPIAGEKITIGEKEFTFVALGLAAVDGDIDIGVDVAASKAAIVAAINGTDGLNAPHDLVTAGAFEGNVSVITAITAGVAGDAIATETTFTDADNKFTGLTLSRGVNGTVGIMGECLIDNEYIYKCVADNTISDKNWRRVSLGEVF